MPESWFLFAKFFNFIQRRIILVFLVQGQLSPRARVSLKHPLHTAETQKQSTFRLATILNHGPKCTKNYILL